MPTTLPFQRRLTKIYNDTKNSYEFAKEPVRNDEDVELQSLHRKLRIQQNRLISWGLEWTDQSKSPDIDESISQAGLSELVGSVMTTIKEILAEAEPLWQSSRSRNLDEKPSEKSGPLIQWDRSRFEDLMRDLTMSIDTLYDLSKTRQTARGGLGLRTAEPSRKIQKFPEVEERQFESSRMSTPQQVDPASLIWPKSLMQSPHGRSKTTTNLPRQIVFMRRPVTSSDLRATIGQPPPPVPILLEYAPYNSIYSITGITPSMTRFERLFAGLSQAYFSTDKLLVGLLRLIGYYEEAEYSRFCLLFALPTNFGPIDIESPSMRMPTINTLSDLLISPAYEPTLEVKYRLAYNVANAVFDLHAKGIVHGNLVSSNILFIEHPTSTQSVDLTQVNMRQSYLASYDLFSDNATDSEEPIMDKSGLLYRHSLDPRITKYTNLTAESKSLDLYSLAMILLEIGLWSSLSDLFPRASTIPSNPTDILKHLASRCGSIYVKAVQACWKAPEAELSKQARPDVMHQKVFFSVCKALDACCAIDDVSDDGDESVESPFITPTPKMESSTPSRYRRDPQIDLSMPPEPEINWSEKPKRERTPERINTNWAEKQPSVVQPAKTKTKPKLKTFPAIRISQEHLNFWHTNIMPHINHVLRSFYKKYPESIEISLESVGETSSQTKPTILVICTSVNKVRSILKKSLVYDKATYGLKVCRGKVVRSRKDGVKRSMAHGDEIEAQNTKHQERPQNGASMGAYINDHHLPPVSLGGVITIDDKPYGMSVHHMLDDPSEDDEPSPQPIHRSSARAPSHFLEPPDLTHSESSYYSSGDEEYNYTLSDYSSASASPCTSDDSSFPSEDEDDSDAEFPTLEPGDIPPIPISSRNKNKYPLTQPAIDDIDPEFYPDAETRDEDHLDSCLLGNVHTTSGIKRLVHEDLTHEIDWALFEFLPERLPSSTMTGPTGVVPLAELPDLKVKCTARTSGTQTGRILPSMSILKIYGRKTPSVSWQVAGKIGVPGDSGAWVVEREGDRVAGSVLAWSPKKAVGYICPLWISILDMGSMLKPRSIGFLSGETVWMREGVGAKKEEATVDVHGIGDYRDSGELVSGMVVGDLDSDLDVEGEIYRMVGVERGMISSDDEDIHDDENEADDESEEDSHTLGHSSLRTSTSTSKTTQQRKKRREARTWSGGEEKENTMERMVGGLKGLQIEGVDAVGFEGEREREKGGTGNGNGIKRRERAKGSVKSVGSARSLSGGSLKSVGMGVGNGSVGIRSLG